MKINRWIMTMAGAVALAWSAGASAQTTDVFIDNDGDGISDVATMSHSMRRGGPGGGYMGYLREMTEELYAQLSDAQKAEIDALISSMREGEATPEEIHAALGAKYQEYGLTLPENWNIAREEFRDKTRLSNDQRTEIRALIDAMKTEGKTAEEIRAAVEAKLAEWDKIAMPGHGFGRGLVPPPDVLTADQRTEIQALVGAMKEEGKTAEEIRTAIDAKFTEWGVTVPVRGEPMGGMMGDRLTVDQRTEIRSIVETMRDAGNTGAEIRAAVDAKLTEWGATRPEPPRGPGRQGGRRR